MSTLEAFFTRAYQDFARCRHQDRRACEYRYDLASRGRDRRNILAGLYMCLTQISNPFLKSGMANMHSALLTRNVEERVRASPARRRAKVNHGALYHDLPGLGPMSTSRPTHLHFSPGLDFTRPRPAQQTCRPLQVPGSAVQVFSQWGWMANVLSPTCTQDC